MQHQQLRHQYLATIGITSWLSRCNLTAAESPGWKADFVYSQDANQSNHVTIDGQVNVQAGNSENVQLNEHVPQNNTAALNHARSLSDSLASSSNSLVDPVLSANSSMSVESSDNSSLLIAQQAARETVTHLPVLSEQLAEVSNAGHSLANQPDIAPAKVERENRMPLHVPLVTSSLKDAPVMRLMFWQYKDVLIVDSLPTQTRGTLASAQYEQLVTNMIKAMKLDSQRMGSDTQPYVLNWPTLAGVSIDQGWDQAVSAVQHKLAKLLQNYMPALVLMLGESAAQMIMAVEDDFDALRGVVFSLRTQTKAITSYSLTQMLNVPGCKKEVWLDLQKVMNTSIQPASIIK
ncbi:MAG: hypothetical protein V7784_18450 [Oceanospirillaceae bacterium]